MVSKMQLLRLIRCEFIKHFSWKKTIIIFLVLVVSCFGLMKMESFFGSNRSYTSPISIEEFDDAYQKANKTLEEETNFVNVGVAEVFSRLEKPYKDTIQLLGNGSDKSCWQQDALSSLNSALVHLVVLEQVQANWGNSLFMEEVSSLAQEKDHYDMYYGKVASYTNQLKEAISLSPTDFSRDFTYYREYVDLVTRALEENAYYLYIEAVYQANLYYATVFDTEINENTLAIYQMIIDEKIMDDSNYRVVNAQQYLEEINREVEAPTLEEYHQSSNQASYENVKTYYRTLNEDFDAKEQILHYAIQHDLKHDLYYPSNYESLYSYQTAKNFMNQGLHLIVVVIFIVAITHAGITSREHDSGTVKLLLSKPVKRSKILLSKFLYLIIETFILWLIASLILFILVGISYGFGELFTPKLLFISGEVREIPYFLWYLGNMIVGMIPACFFLSLILFLSSITLSTALTASVTSILTLFSIMIWVLVSNFGLTFLKFFCYTPIPYLDYWMVSYHSEYYLESCMLTGLYEPFGLIISLVFILILYFLTVFIYTKRDIKN